MNVVKVARSWGTSTKVVAAFNLVMVVAVGLVLVLTETSWNRCLAEIDPGRLSLSHCQGNLMNGQAAIFFLLVPLWVLGDLVFAVVWLWRRRSAGIRSAPATWVALGLSVFGIITMPRLGYLFSFPYLLTAPGVVAGLVAMKQSERTGRRDELAVASVVIGCVGVVVGVGMWMTA
jgi:hypothetical protein